MASLHAPPEQLQVTLKRIPGRIAVTESDERSVAMSLAIAANVGRMLE